MPKKKVVVIGAGIVGSCCALRLAKDGYSVTLIDKSMPGHGCSFGNAGGISSSSIIPMAIPGIWKKIPEWLFDREGPLSVRWKHIPKAFPWLFKWLLESRESHAKYAAHTLSELNKDVLNQYKAILGEEEYNRLIKTTGHLHVFKEKPVSKGDFFVKSLRDDIGVHYEELYGEDIRNFEPSLSDDIRYALYIGNASYTVNPHLLVNAVVKKFEEIGGIFVQDDVKEVIASEAGARVVSRVNTHDADFLVVCAGALSKTLMRKDLDKVMLENERGYHLTLMNPSFMPNLPIVSGDHKFFSTPMNNGLRLAGTVEFSGLSSLPNWSRADTLLSNAKSIFPSLSASGSEAWVGDRPSFPSSIPLIDVSPTYKNVFYAFGHGHYGMSGAPGTANIIADMVSGNSQKVDITPFSYAMHC
ncbi:NAD(P)/FAD-dependent oxidoreductase [Aidingimonas lacisalsi]|uniref:NAD(P)/FAD-dependent oxidoreductase n=1 Tax=Aidingimonas lacisalsi TaxID=2604086 RepID=UPI0011D248D8|nr:FAD-dependent oxidoreductase [Aidingimonas lacisalsi]